MRTLARVTMLAITLLALAYAGLPWWLPAVTIELLEREGANNVLIELSHPSLRAFEIERFEFEIDDLHVGVTGAQLEYRPGGLLDGRLELLRAARIFIVQLPISDSAVPSATGTDFAIPPPSLLWQHVPIDRIEADSVELRFNEPEFHVVGQFALDPIEASYRFVNMSPGDLDGLTLAGHIERVGMIRAKATLPSSPNDAPLVSVEGRIDSPGAAELSGTLRLTGVEFELLDPLLGVSTDTARLKANFTARYHSPIHAIDSPPEVTAEGSFALDWSGSEPAPADLSTQGTFSYHADQWSIALTEATTLTVELSADPTLELQLRHPTDLVLSYAEDQLTVRGGLQLSIPEASLDGPATGFEGGWLDIEPAVVSRGDVNFKGRLSGITRYDAHRIPGQFAIAGSYADSLIDGSLTVTLPGTPIELAIRLSHDLGNGIGQARVLGDISIDTPLLAALLPGWGKSSAEVFDLDSGRLTIDGTVDWQSEHSFEAKAAARATLADVGGVAAENPFRHAAGSLALAYQNGTWHADSDNLSIGELDVGFPINDIGVEFSANENLLDVATLNGRTLGGTFQTSPFRYTIDRGNTAFDLQISKLSLAEVLALEGEEITGSGRLNGVIPVNVADNTFAVTQGMLESEPPGGMIRYAGAAGAVAAVQQPGLDFALRALGDFNYESLTANVDYAPDGTLSVGISLVGNNPAVESGRTIHYNLNVTENLPDLLLSLRLSDELSQGIQNKLNR